ncbi:NUDIX hydrolase [Phenylobacterium deserti]|uniref:NUDIX hydrolase n=1 Tax=Phenylobacterium deserti TaxID=1914756 RepID=UPI001F0C3524|nr:NUDIX hydrolase [Phenylobacterium deserti]
MSEFEKIEKPEGPPRIAGARAVRPKDAATLILVRRDGAAPRILMGRRSGGHSFMPNLWVFPGGRVDRADYRAPHGTDLRAEVAATFEAHASAARGRALALAAIRETFEEAGLLLARPAPARPAAGPWREFLAHGALPDLAAVEILARAVTPPAIGKRFDTWFLMADAERLMSLDRRPDSGELEEIGWFTHDEALSLPLPQITRGMVRETLARLEHPERPRPYMRFRHGAVRIDAL